MVEVTTTEPGAVSILIEDSFTERRVASAALKVSRPVEIKSVSVPEMVAEKTV